MVSQHNKNSFLLYIHVKTTYTAILILYNYDPDYIFVNLWVYTNILNLDAQLADDDFLHLIVSFQIKEQ